MKISKAIELLKDLNLDRWRALPPDQQDAVNLGLEALKRTEDMRKSPCTTADEILPGETSEEP